MHYSIQDISKAQRISSRTLRVWEEEGLLTPERDKNGIRQFDDNLVKRIDKIKILKEFGFRLRDIEAILNHQTTGEIREVVQTRREMLDQQAQSLLAAQRKLRQLDDIMGNEPGFNYFAKPETIFSEHLNMLLKRHGLQDSAPHREFLAHEIATVPSEDLLTWTLALQKVVEYAKKHDVRTHHIRGFGASSLLLFLTGFSTIDPVREGLIPHNPALQDLHFDIPYSGMEHFFDFLSTVNTEIHHMHFVSFRLPILDIIRNFMLATSFDPYKQPLQVDVSALMDLGIAHIFGIDYSGNALINRVYPYLSSEARSAEVTDKDLRKLAPKTKEGVLRFLALRQNKTMDLYQRYINGETIKHKDCGLSRSLFGLDRGFVVYREELLVGMQSCTQWSWARVSQLRRAVRLNCVTDEDRDAFIAATDADSFRLLEKLEPFTFHKSHVVSWWQLIACTYHCKMHDPQAWLRTLRTWEDSHSMQWNDFGVDLPDVKLLG